MFVKIISVMGAATNMISSVTSSVASSKQESIDARRYLLSWLLFLLMCLVILPTKHVEEKSREKPVSDNKLNVPETSDVPKF